MCRPTRRLWLNLRLVFQQQYSKYLVRDKHILYNYSSFLNICIWDFINVDLTVQYYLRSFPFLPCLNAKENLICISHFESKLNFTLGWKLDFILFLGFPAFIFVNAGIPEVLLWKLVAFACKVRQEIICMSSEIESRLRHILICWGP